jgi:3-methyladenine DNA glycosylase AlkD
MADPAYADFQRKLMPGIIPETVIGVRTPQLRSYAKDFFRCGTFSAFMQQLPHETYEENNLHGMLISMMKDELACIRQLNLFLPYVNNWATCDLIRPKCFPGDREVLLGEIKQWITSDHIYTIRFGIEMLMLHFLREDFRPEFLDLVSNIYSNEYYVNNVYDNVAGATLTSTRVYKAVVNALNNDYLIFNI